MQGHEQNMRETQEMLNEEHEQLQTMHILSLSH